MMVDLRDTSLTWHQWQQLLINSFCLLVLGDKHYLCVHLVRWIRFGTALPSKEPHPVMGCMHLMTGVNVTGILVHS